jgi:ribosomal protein S21
MRKTKNFNNRHKNQPLSTCVTVTAAECNGDNEKMIRKFSKKVKRSGIIDECRERQYFKKPSVLATERRMQRKRVIQQVNRKRNELLTTGVSFKKRRNR